MVSLSDSAAGQISVYLLLRKRNYETRCSGEGGFGGAVAILRLARISHQVLPGEVVADWDDGSYGI